MFSFFPNCFEKTEKKKTPIDFFSFLGIFFRLKIFHQSPKLRVREKFPIVILSLKGASLTYNFPSRPRRLIEKTIALPCSKNYFSIK